MKTDPRVDAYIAQAAPFAQPILIETRKRVGQAAANFEETIKWNVPFFLLDGKFIVSMAAFKKHVKVLVWLGAKPTSQDVAAVSGAFSPAKEFVQRVKAAIAQASAATTTGTAKKAPAKKAPAKKAPAKKAPAKKAPAKKASAKKA